MCLSFGVGATEVALVTALSGNVTLLQEKAGAQALQAFVKVRAGDRLSMAGDARVQLVFFANARQETWQGSGTLELGSLSGKTLKGGGPVESKILPALLVKQLAKTPSSGGNVKAGMMRLRILPKLETVESVEKTYANWRQQAEASERSPELSLLASYFELRAFEKLDTLLGQMAEKTPQDPDLAALVALYTRAITEAKASAAR
jgi:hypothetical protein